MELYDILVKSANSALNLIDEETGAMPPGHNGSYHDPETPVRNTSHWLITFLKAYSISGDVKFLDASHRLAKYLCSDHARPMKAAFWHRKNPHKDTCNGLVGQAWTIEALTVAAQELEMPELSTLARDVFLLHPFESTYGLWQSVSADGTYLKFDFTFNHQLWFAASGGLLANLIKSNEISDRVQCFLSKASFNFKIHSFGLIHQPIPLKLFPFNAKLYKAIEQLRNIRNLKNKPKKQKVYMTQKEVGYHGFNLYAFSLLKTVYPNNSFWNKKKFLAALDYMQSERYWHDVKNSNYGYPYNPPGFEIPYALDTFCSDTQIIQRRWVTEQIRSCYNFESNLMNRNTPDPMTHAARLYEATRLSNLEIDLESVLTQNEVD
jgi:hypothetical protein